MKITPEQFIAQWTKGYKAQPFISHFERALFDFTTLAGQYSEQRFKSSFDSKSFIGVGPAWKPRRWHPRDEPRGNEHPLLDDFGTLKRGIKNYQPPMSHTFLEQAPGPGHRKINRKGSYYLIYTQARTTAREKKHRGMSTKSNQSYVAVHNTDPKLGLFRVNQHPGAGLPEQRQFMGFHPAIDAYIQTLIPDIFDEFPLH